MHWCINLHVPNTKTCSILATQSLIPKTHSNCATQSPIPSTQTIMLTGSYINNIINTGIIISAHSAKQSPIPIIHNPLM